MNCKHRYEILLKDAYGWLKTLWIVRACVRAHVILRACVHVCVHACSTHLKELVGRAVACGGRGRSGGVVVAPVQLAETVDAVKVTGIQLGQIDIWEV